MGPSDDDAASAAPAAGVAPPALRFRDLVVKHSVAGSAPATPQATRDLPDLARFLFFALGARDEAAVHVLDHLTFDVDTGSALALVGEDGAGKSTVAYACARLLKPSSGAIEVDGINAHKAHLSRGLAVRRNLQVLFDDPEAGIDPRLPVAETLTLADDALRLAGRGPRRERFAAALARVHLDPAVLGRRASTLSAGQKKRVALARALLAEPSVLVVDEPAGGLDPSERAAILETLAVLRNERRAALLVLCKDLAAARSLADRVGVLQHGALVELRPTEQLFEAPEHSYTRALVAAAPRVRR